MKTVFIIEDDPIMADCLALAVQKAGATPQIFPDAINAIDALDQNLPALILLDILLRGPDGFTLLNELASYPDTSAIPIIIVTSLDLSQQTLSHYNIKQVFNKTTMVPQELVTAIQEHLHAH